MAFTAQTEDKESLQALAFALRQEKGSEIEYAEVESAMQDYMAVDAKVRDCCGIEEAKFLILLRSLRDHISELRRS